MQNPRKGVIPEIAARPKAFALTFLTAFLLLFVFLWSVDALPEPLAVEVVSEGIESQTGAAEMPVRVVAPSIKLDESVSNPASENVNTLDAALLKGSVRWPTSAHLGVNGTVLLFGHSSYLPVVHNQAYKAFNRIQDLKTGEVISVYSATTEYRYKVVSVRSANAEEDVVELLGDKKYLTLVTCDSFGKKTSRFVVTAEYSGAYAL